MSVGMRPKGGCGCRRRRPESPKTERALAMLVIDERVADRPDLQGKILRGQSGPIRLSEKRRARGMPSSRPRFAPIILLALVFTTSLMLGTAVAAGAGSEREAAEIHAKAQRIQDVIDDLAGRLSLKRD